MITIFLRWCRLRRHRLLGHPSKTLTPIKMTSRSASLVHEGWFGGEGWIRAAALALLLPAAAAANPPADPTYAALRAARPAGRAVAVEGLVLERDAFRFSFEKGSFQFLADVDGKPPGAVFVGTGSWELTPANASERRHLAFLSRQADLEKLSDRFGTLLLYFSDDTAAEIAKGGRPAEALPGAAEVHERLSRLARRDLKTNLATRLLADRLRATPSQFGVFLALVDGEKLPPLLAAVDPWNVERLGLLGELLGGAETGLFVHHDLDGGWWYLEHRKAEAAAGAAHAPRVLSDALHYEIDTTIQANAAISGRTVVRFELRQENLRVLPIALLSKLRIAKAELARGESGEDWAEIPFIQEAPEEDAGAAVILPAALPGSEPLRLRVSYDGKEVLRNVGEGNFVVDARESWYPNLGIFTDLATFDLVFRAPKVNEVVSVGRFVESRLEGDTRIATWKAESPIRVAGFNYGKFKKLEQQDKDSGLKLQVFTNPGTPDVINEINEILRQASDADLSFGSPIPGDLDNPFASPGATSGPRSVSVSPESLAENCMADGMNTARVGTAYFGPLPAQTVSITQQSQWSFGQSWPSLIFLPYLAFLDSTTRLQFGLQDAREFVESVGPHEFAHQWWGHHVGWSSYRDQWLSEGFAEFTATLVLQHTRGMAAYRTRWEKARKSILGKPPGAEIANDAAGPISMGWRLATRRNPYAYGITVYEKGAFVLHMLRMMMRESGKNADARFMAMMRDFATTYAQQSPSTADFQKIVEKHMTAAMNLAGDGRMSWFFEQWIQGTDIPRYRVAVEAAKEGEGYRLKGSIRQEAVGPAFRATVPLYAEFSKNEIARIGAIPMQGTTDFPVDVVLKLPKKPRRIFVNAMQEVLARD